MNNRLKIVSALLAAVGLISLSACGGSSSAASDGGLTHVRLSIGSNSVGNLDALVALGAGFFKKEGLDVQQLPYITDSSQALIQGTEGRADIVQNGATALFAVRSKNRDAVLFAKSCTGQGVQIVISKTLADKLAAKGITPQSPMAERVKALAGKRIAFTALGANIEKGVDGMFADFGVKVDTSNYVAIPQLPSLATALQRNQIDAFAISPPTSLVAKQGGYGVVFIDGFTESAQVPSWNNIIYIGAMTTRAYAKAHPDVLKAYIRAIDDADALIKNNLSAAIAAYGKYVPDLDKNLLTATVKTALPAFASGPSIDQTNYEQTLKLYNLGAPQQHTDSYAKAFFPVNP